MFQIDIKSKEKEDICLQLKAENHAGNYIIDCGFASGLSVKDCQDIKAIFISHTHIDHFINFDHILRNQIGIEKEIIICGPKDIASQVQSRIKGYTWNLIQKGSIKYQIREIISPSEIKVYELEPPVWELKEIKTADVNTLYSNDIFKVRYTILNHGIDSIAYLFEGREKININLKESPFGGGPWVNKLKEAYVSDSPETEISIGENTYQAKELYHLLTKTSGQKVGFILDHDASEENHAKIKELFFEADQVFIESFYKADEISFAKTNLHSYSIASAQIMRESKVKSAIPIHFSRRYEQEDIQDIFNEFEKEFTSSANTR